MKYLVKFSRYASSWWAGALVPSDGNLGSTVVDVRYYGTWEQAMADVINRIAIDRVAV